MLCLYQVLHQKMLTEKNFTGVLLINTGTPLNPEPSAIREYLKEFLSDIRVVHLPRFIWIPILYLFILPIRPHKKTYDYKKIWMKEGSPILVIFQKFLNKSYVFVKNMEQFDFENKKYGPYSAGDVVNELPDSLFKKFLKQNLIDKFKYNSLVSDIFNEE